MPVSVERRPDLTVLRFEVRRLDHDTTRDLMPQDLDVENRRVGLDLRALDWVEPFGLVYLFWYIEALLDSDVMRVDVALPPDENVSNYLARMRLAEALEATELVTLHNVRGVRERDLPGRLVELTTFRVDNDDEVEDQTARLMEVILTQRPDLRSQHEELSFTISELLSNIQVHSRTGEAAIAAQAYPQQGSVVLAIGDGGVGIPVALRPHLSEQLSDAEVISRALEPGVSSRHGLGGMGLTELADLVAGGGERLAIRSGTGHVIVTRRTRNAEDGCSSLPGAIVEVALPC